MKQYHTIPNIATFCTSEQIIAYSFSFHCKDMKLTAEQARKYMEESFNEYVKDNKVNKDTAVDLFFTNFQKYRNLKYHILTSYTEVANIFKL